MTVEGGLGWAVISDDVETEIYKEKKYERCTCVREQKQLVVNNVGLVDSLGSLVFCWQCW